ADFSVRHRGELAPVCDRAPVRLPRPATVHPAAPAAVHPPRGEFACQPKAGFMTDRLTPVAIGHHLVGPNQPVYMIGESGINHNVDAEIAKQLMEVAVTAGAQAVKFQKRNPEVAVPEHQKSKIRSTPWGEMTYSDYKHRVEFGIEEYAEIDRYAKEVGLQWFASPWDTDSVDFLESEFDALTYKVASASLTDFELLRAIASTGKPVLCSSGMSDWETLDRAVEVFDRDRLVLMH